ncbi:MAG: type II toxin-antitoxin system Phd/YefM family antitoxin [Microcystis sp.]|jgi:antitoxin YefM|uniref:Antitoxin n=15 Tax=Microcystis TaxID=1125 RepID=A0A6H9G9R2_MICAE|nr:MULTISPECIES: type II toxin-antitoxin system Phd/YefM family antitoxin [Microcystis]MCA2818009.1 type II toxin-antitoxin system Phd/YefM family antitoxin [Microcystis sp. M085S1]MCA2857016.1 type II toxin-antitoxin system Phd/YefM family antitoxin [Microcystis sp. M065S1]MCE2664694.1 type II toxin-antitoxin system Phd/YefM family antitoxin [Microcystis sp. 53602_E8]MCE2672401.1 type II toxin-antitoxin system Phd/YefM family antitoxin [Microcystis sp. 53598_E5]MCZ8057120.1 type II toxin-anti
MAMLPIPTTYTSYTQAQEHFLQVLEQVELGNSIVIVQRQGHHDVALIAADELSALLEEVYLLRSPANAQRLFQSLNWSQERLSQTAATTSLEELRQELETEIEQEKAAEV